MLNIQDLERRWIKYKIKTYVPLILGATGLVVATIFATFYISLEKETPIIIQKKIVVKEKNISIIPKKEVIKEIIVVEEKVTKVKEILPNNSKRDERLVLKPSLSFMDNIEDNLSPYNYEEEKAEIKQKKVVEVPTKVVETKVVEEKAIPIPTQPKKLVLSVKEQSSTEDLKDVIRRFKKNKNPTLSLFIAKRYYDLGNYQKSYNYALMTNEIDKKLIIE